jgi:hypothetical protein
VEENLQGGNETKLFAGYRVFCNGSPERLLVFNALGYVSRILPDVLHL